MAVLSRARHNGVLLVTLLLGQLVLMSGSVRGGSGSTVLESWVMRVSAPVVGAGRAFGGMFGGMSGGVRELFGARRRNAELELEVERLRAEVERQREAEQQNLRLRELLQMREQLGLASIGASVVFAVADEHARMIVVDRGAADGVEPQQAVVAWGGVVGRVVAVGPHHAKVWLVTDPNSVVAGVVQRSRAQGMVHGAGRDGLDLRYVPTYADVMHGDRVVTSGIDRTFPRGLGLGTVSAISRSADGIQTIAIDPALDLAGLEEVLIVLERPPDIEEPE